MAQPSPLLQLLSPDGYYTYFQIQKGTTVDTTVLQKRYRKLSLQHHPDKGGNETTFTALKRAQTVLSNDKLRAQYDLTGIDLDDDEVVDADNEKPSALQEMASIALAALIQVLIRTGMYIYIYKRLDC